MKKRDSAETDKTQEDELPEYRRKREERLKKRRRRRRQIVALIILVLICLYAAINWDKFSPSSLANTFQGFFGEFSAGGFPLTISSGNFKNAVPVGSNIGVLTDTSVIIYSQSGSQLVQRQHGMSNPNIESAGGKAVVFDRGGKTFRVETRFDEPYIGTTSFPIISAAISQSGKLAVVTESDSYLSELTVYDTSYRTVFKWSSAKGYIFSSALSPDGKKVAAIVINTDKGSYRTSLYIFDITRQNPLSVSNFDGLLPLSIQYIDNDKIAVVGDTESVFLSNDGKKQNIYPYNSKTLKCYTNRNGITALAFGTYGTGNTSTVVSLSGVGSVVGNARIKYDVQSVFACDGKLAALTDAGIWHSDALCKNAAEISASGDKILALPFKKSIYVFGQQAVYRYKLS